MSGIYWLASYPKSGNTWVRALLTNYLRDSDQPADINELEISAIGSDRETFDELLGIESADLTNRQIMYYRPLIYERISAEHSEPLFLKVHDAFEYNDEGQAVFSKQATVGAIYLIRNPLDVVVSYAHHQNTTIDRTIGLMNKIDADLAGHNKTGTQIPQKLRSWSKHVCSWTDEPGLNILIVRYEDIIQLTFEIFTAILHFAGLEIEESRVKKAIKFSRFEKLQAQEKLHGFAEKPPPAKSFFRQGKSGSWRGILSEKQISQIIEDHSAVMRRFGYLGSNDEVLF